MSILRGRVVPLFLAAVAGTAFALTPATPALAATWSVVPTPNASNGLNLFAGVDALSTTDAWAVGRADHSPQQPFIRPLAARWNGSSWTIVNTPLQSGQFNGVDGNASNNVWAVGVSSSGSLTERWNGTSWSVVPSPSPPNSLGTSLSGVKTFSTTNAWAVGTFSTSTAPSVRTLIQQWNGTSWSIVASPSPDPTQNFLTDVDGASANDVWAIGNIGNDGYGGTTAGLVLHWNGSSWSQVNVPGAVSDGTFNVPTLQDVFAVSANDVWIVGRAFSWIHFKTVPIALHWDGQTWQRSVMANAPNDGQGFHGVAALSSTKVYAVGSVIARWTGTTWAAESATVPGLLSDAAATGTSTVWGVGWRYDPNLAQLRTLAMRTTNG
jgi:hypothetical protein